MGHIMWVAAGRPCIEPFVPWYTEMERAYDGWGRFSTAEEAEMKHFSDAKEMRANYPDAKVWETVDKWDWLNEDYKGRIGRLLKERYAEQKRLFKAHNKRVEKLKASEK